MRDYCIRSSHHGICNLAYPAPHLDSCTRTVHWLRECDNLPSHCSFFIAICPHSSGPTCIIFCATTYDDNQNSKPCACRLFVLDRQGFTGYRSINGARLEKNIWWSGWCGWSCKSVAVRDNKRIIQVHKFVESAWLQICTH